VFGVLQGLLNEDSFHSYLGSVGGIVLSSDDALPLAPPEEEEDAPGPTISKLKFELNQTGISVNLVGHFNGALTTTIDLGTFTFQLKLNRRVVAAVHIRGISLSRSDPTFNVWLVIEPLDVDGEGLEDVMAGIQGLGSGNVVGVMAGLSGVSVRDKSEGVIEWLDTFLGGIDVCLFI
jgi:hypothetical protein